MDAVYILGNGSIAENKEIRYSLRMLEKNMADLGSVFVVGECPDWLQNLVHIPASDEYAKFWKNAMLKTRAACIDERVSAEFLLMNDDFFMCAEFVGADFPFYARKRGDGGASGRHWFGVHCPIRINKEMYLKLPLTLEMNGDFSPRSFYANFYGAPPEFVEDQSLRAGDGMPSFDMQIKQWDFFTIGSASSRDPGFWEWLDGKYPMPSRFER